MASLTIISPPNGAVVKGIINVKVEYRGPGFVKTDLYRDNTLVATSTMSTAAFAVNTTAIADGGHTFKAVATYTRTKTVQASVSVTVSNTTSTDPPPPPPNPLYPPSYSTGPLGSNNVLPAAYGGALLIMWSDASGDTGIAASNRALVQQRMTDCSRTFDCVGMHYAYNETPGASPGSLNTGGEAWINSLGSVPIVSWSPGATVAQINSGAFDSTYRAAANYWKGLGFTVMLRMMYEFDGAWFPWQATTATTTAWVMAWKRIVGLFQTAGASNVGFFWCPTEGQNRAIADACYPGDAYVDWVGTDSYNWDDAGWATPLHAGWAEFDELLNYGVVGTNVSRYNTYSPKKPFVVGETSSKFHTGTAGRKAAFFTNIATVAKPKMPLLCGIQIFDQWLPGEGNDWRVDSNQPSGTASKGSVDATTYTGFKTFAAAAAFNVGVAS